MDTIRTFIAIELSPDTLAQLAQIQARLKARAPRASVRWVHTDGIHLTLKFLGETPRSQLDTIETTLRGAVQHIPAFSFNVGQAGCFPNASRPRVVWIGVQEPTGILNRVQRAVESAIAPLGYPTEDRSFSPHLTLGRVARNASANDARQVGDSVLASNIGALGTVTARDVALIQSTLKPSGAEYTILMRAPLATR